MARWSGALRVPILLVTLAIAATSLSLVQRDTIPRAITTADLTYRGAFKLPGSNGSGKGAGLAYAPSRGTWFVANGRTNDYTLLEIHLPDDPDYPGGAQPPSPDQASAPAATVVANWGPRLSTALGGPLDPSQDDIFGLYWDDDTSRLYVSFADFYGPPATNDAVLAIDFSTPFPTIRGPWRFGSGSDEFYQQWGFSQFVRAPATLRRVVPGMAFLASGHSNNTFQNGSWGPDLLLVADPAPSAPTHAILPAQQVMFWPATRTPVTLDTGKLKNGLLSSNMLRRDPFYVISGNSTNYLGGSLLWSDVPYGRATLTSGWANGDNAGHFVAIDEPDVAGVLFFGSYTVGTIWYGPPNEFADDVTRDPSSPTGFRSWAGIDAPRSQAYFRSPVFPPDPAMNPKGYVYDHQGGSKGNKHEAIVPAVWIYGLDDLAAAAIGSYRPRPGLTPVNVDARQFAVLAAPFSTPDLQPVFPALQYNDNLNRYTDTTTQPLLVEGAYYRPDGTAGLSRRLYVRMSSRLTSQSSTDVVNVFDVRGRPAVPQSR